MLLLRVVTARTPGYPIKQFAIQEPQNPSIGASELHNILRMDGF